MSHMSGFFTNEQRCLSNAIYQACLKNEISATHGVPPLVRRMVETHKIPFQDILGVELHQCPQLGGFVKYELTVHTRMASWSEPFQGSGFDLEHDTFTLYDRRRDGKVEYLYLQH